MPPVTSQSGMSGGVPADGNSRLAPPFLGEPTAAAPVRKVPAADELTHDDASVPWADFSDEGTVEPMFEADVSETEAVLASLAKAEAEFPLDAFIIPEQSKRVPTGLEGKPVSNHPAPTPVTELAERLEKLSHRLRVEDSEVVLRRLAAGDKLDALLGGLLAGFLAGSK